MEASEMLGPVALGLVVKIGVALVGLFLVPFLLSKNNTRTGTPFMAVMERINENAVASAVFHGLVFMGMCTLLGLLFG
jgi:hypothetical protein